MRSFVENDGSEQRFEAALNRLLYSSERAFKYDPGLPKREWFKHLIYAPGFYTGYGVKTLPGIREGIEQKAWDEPRKYIPIVADAINRFASRSGIKRRPRRS